VNTRADLGPCTKTHDEELKKQYVKSSRCGKLGYEEDFERLLRSLLNDVERRIRRGIERLKLTQSETANQVGLI
jgi:gamma-glutamylcysteine synthetase